jgi:hypothetical protein
MNKKTVIGLNQSNYVGVYISIEDIEFTETWMERNGNNYTNLHTKSGKVVKVLGDAYYILGLDKKQGE